MRSILYGILLCVLGFTLFHFRPDPKAVHHTYYFSADGNDNSSGLSPSAAWKSMGKLNAFTFREGDSIRFRRGDTFAGTLNLFANQVGNQLYFGAYGPGERPVLTGLKKLTAWKKVGGNLWQNNQLTSDKKIKVVVINDTLTPMGRYPDDRWDKISEASHTSITISENTAKDWTGGELVMQVKDWVSRHEKILAQHGRTFEFKKRDDLNPSAGWGFFIQDHIKTLTRDGEWYYEPATHAFTIYSTGEPRNIYVADAPTLANFWDKDAITLRDLAFHGNNDIGLYFQGTSNLRIENCDFRFNGSRAIYGGFSDTPEERWTISNCTFAEQPNFAIHVAEHGQTNHYRNSIILGNTFHRIGLYPGLSGEGEATALYFFGNGLRIANNRFDSIGYNGIYFNGDNAMVQNNFLNHYNLTAHDGAAIYTEGIYAGRKIISNIAISGGVIDKSAFPPGREFFTHGIYLDEQSSGVLVAGNVASENEHSGIFLHRANNNTITKNLCYDNMYGLGIMSTSQTEPVSGNRFSDNEFIAKCKINSYSQAAVTLGSPFDDYQKFGVFDNNYYGRISDSKPVFHAVTDQWRKSLDFDFQGWKAFMNQDARSKSPASFAGYELNGIFLINPDSINKSVRLKGNYVDIRGRQFRDRVNIPPFSGIVLIQKE